MNLFLQFDPQTLDFIANRLRAGTMDFQTAINVQNVLNLLQAQLNNKEFQDKLAEALKPKTEEVKE